MHESGMIRRMLTVALDEAQRQGGRLIAIEVRLGALAGGSVSHLREHFEHELEALGMAPIALRIEEQPEHPSGVEITGLELAR